MALAFGDEADQAEAAQKADNAAQLRNETWAGIDTLVREFIPEAVRRGIKPKATGIIRRSRAVEFWDVQSSKSKRDSLTITTDGNWALHREVPNGHTEWLTDSAHRDKTAPPETDLVDGLREGATRLLEGSALGVQRTESRADEKAAKLLRRWLWGFVLFFLSIGLFIGILMDHYRVSSIQAATPTTATIDKCGGKYSRHGVWCKGTWNLDGQRYHGSIEEVEEELPPGTTVDVRANRVRAYLMPIAPSPSDWTLTILAGGVLALAIVILVVSERSSRDREG